MKHFLLYSSARLGLLIVVGGFAWAAGMRGLLLVVVAFLGSGLLSIFVLRRPRAELGSDLGGFFKRINDRIDAATVAEDSPGTGPTDPNAGAADDRPADQRSSDRPDADRDTPAPR